MPEQKLLRHLAHCQAAPYIEASFSGPLPDPATLKAYDMVLPGLAERIVNRWETQSDHRISLEKTVIAGDNKRANWGLTSATIISLAVISVSGILAMHGHETVAAILAGVGIAALAGVFVYGTNSRKRERIEKSKVMTGQIEKRR
jgi:uncharacterized membrane protein